MRLSQTQEGGTLPGAGGARFIPAHRVADACAELKARRYVVARATPLKAERRRERSPERGSAPPPRAAVGLRGAIEEAVESALAIRGALPPGVSVHADLAICIRDQMLRVRALGATGLAIALPRLGDVLEPGLLDAEDSAVLSAWIRAAPSEALTLLLDDQDRHVAALAPVPLELLVQSACGARAVVIRPQLAPPVAAARAIPSDPRPESVTPKPATIPQASIVLTESACGGDLA